MTEAVTKDRSQQVLIPILVSLLFFLRKGVQYALIGSYVPLLIVALMASIVLLTFFYGVKFFKVFARIWAVLIICWAMTRILFATVDMTIKPFLEYHLTQQFNPSSLLISIVMFILSVYIIKGTKRKS